MIIKHIVELETVINENSNDETALVILGMSEQERQNFFDDAGRGIIHELLEENKINENYSWAMLRVATKETV
jgi:hypothetical protein